MNVRTLTFSAGLALLSACQPQATSVVVPSLNKPGPAAFACYSYTMQAFLPTLAECTGVLSTTTDKRVLSFVLETTRGEIAVIDWHDKRAIDSDRTVPGYTFARVGESPSAIVIPETDSRMTFVANYGSMSVQSIETASFLPDAARDATLVPTTVTLPSGPTDLAYAATASKHYLFAALPEVAQIAVIEVNAADGSLGAPTYVDVSTLVPPTVPAVAPTDYLRLCRADGYARTASVAPRTPLSLGASARPTMLELMTRANGDVELVATDAALPFLHRFRVDDAGITELGGYATAVPTLDVSVTPLVPPTYADAATAQSATEQYIYAIDAFDRSVLVVDANLGSVLPVNVGSRAADRIPYESGALTLETLTPGYDAALDPTLTNRCDPADATDTRRSVASPGSLHGVFVAVALTDGTVGFVDVYDLDAPCRGPTSCGGYGNANDTLVYVHRHRPRMSQFAIAAPTVSSSLVFSYQGNAGRLTSTGAPTSDGPGLLPIDDGDPTQTLCPGTSTIAGRGQMAAGIVATGDATVEGSPLICLLDDPASLRQQRWFALYEGSISAAQGVRGRLVDAGAGVRRFQTEDATFCAWGVLGASDVAAAALGPDDPELGYGGDMLVISADLPPQTMNDVACDGLAVPSSSSGDRRVRLAFAIQEAYQDELVLGDFIIDQGYSLPSILNDDPANAFAKLLYCFPDLVSYDVRVHAAYSVSSTVSRTRHRVIADGVGRCTIDVAGQPFDPAEPDTARAFRALPGRNFIHPEVAFRVSSFPVLSGLSAQLSFDVTTVPIPTRIDIGQLGSALEYNSADQRLYTVDVSSHTVSAYALDPITRNDRVQ